MKPYPLQFEAHFLDERSAIERHRLALDRFQPDQRKATAKLRKYYSRLGFRTVPRTDYMVLSPEVRLPDLDSLAE